MGKANVTPELVEAVMAIVGVAKHLVDNKDAVRIDVNPGRYRVLVELYTDPRDIGQVVGRNGHLTASIRALLAAIQGKHNIPIDFYFVTDMEETRNNGRNHVAQRSTSLTRDLIRANMRAAQRYPQEMRDEVRCYPDQRAEGSLHITLG